MVCDAQIALEPDNAVRRGCRASQWESCLVFLRCDQPNKMRTQSLSSYHKLAAGQNFWLFLAVGYDGQISFFRRAVRTITCHNASQVAQTCSVRCVLLFSSPKYIKSHVAARAHAMIDPRAIAAFAAVVIIVSHFMRIQREALRIGTTLLGERDAGMMKPMKIGAGITATSPISTASS